MTNELPTIQIKGKDYVLVKDRVLAFNEAFGNGSIVCKILQVTDKYVTCQAVVTPDTSKPERQFIACSTDFFGKNIPAFENAETSAVGRALALMGIGVIESIASADEMNKARIQKPKSQTTEVKKNTPALNWTQEQVTEILNSGNWELKTGVGQSSGKPWYMLISDSQRGFVTEQVYNYIKDNKGMKSQSRAAEEVFNQ